MTAIDTLAAVATSGAGSFGAPSGVSMGAAFLAGILSFFSPCVLPLVPVNIAIITGVSVEALMEGKRSAFWPTMSRTLLFVAGFTAIFVLVFGGVSGTIGSLLHEHMAVIRVAGGIICIVFGLHLVGIAPIGLFYRQVRMDIGGGRLGAIGTFLMGMTFAAGWTPCVGPILGTISALAMNEGMVGRAMFLLLVYSAGMALPFLLAAAAMGTFLKLTRKLKRYLHYIEIGSGFLLIVLGILMLTNRFTVLSQLAAAFYSAPR